MTQATQQAELETLRTEKYQLQQYADKVTKELQRLVEAGTEENETHHFKSWKSFRKFYLSTLSIEGCFDFNVCRVLILVLDCYNAFALAVALGSTS